MKKENRKKIMEYVMYALLGVVGALVINIFFGLVIVDGNSMNSTLKDGQFLVMQRKFVDYKVGDIVVADITRFDTGEKDTIIKRIIATEGQTVEIKDGKVFIDDKEIQEDYIKEAMYEQSFDKITVPEGEVYLMGDNRNNSLDSRIQGTVKVKDIQGKILR